MKRKCIFGLILSICLLAGSCSSGNQKRPMHGYIIPQAIMDSLTRNPTLVCSYIDKILPTVNDSTDYYNCLVIKAKAKFFASEMDSTEHFLQKTELFCRKQDKDNPTLLTLYSQLCNMKGNMYVRKAVTDSAIQAFRQAYQYSNASKDIDRLPDICLNLADSYVKKGRYDLGSFWYRRALFLTDSLQLPDEKRFPAYYGIAQVNMELRDYATCDHYYELAYRYYDRMNPYEKHVYLNNRGNSYYYRQDYETALEYFRRSLALVTQYPGMEFERNLTMINLGEVFMLMNQTDSASHYLNHCYDFFHSIHNNTALYYIDTQLIELALKQNNVALARQHLQNSLKPEAVDPNMVHIRNRYLQHYYEETGDFKQAYFYQSYNNHIDDSIRNERIKMRAAEISLKYKQDSTLMKKEIFIREKENQVLILHQWLFGIGLSSLLLLAVASAVILYRKRKHDKEQWRIQTDMNSLRLKNIRNRISPHFIFNVLNREVNEHRSEKESRNLMGLVKLLRRNLELTDNLAVTLADELDFVNTYVQLEEKTLGKEFTYVLNTGNSPLQRINVPAMLLQIPVENAIKHALRCKEGKRILQINIIHNDNSGTLITVRDNGGGYHPGSGNRGTGTGMKVLTQTIQLLNSYNRHPIVMTISNVRTENDETGCEVRFSIPAGYSYQLKE